MRSTTAQSWSFVSVGPSTSTVLHSPFAWNYFHLRNSGDALRISCSLAQALLTSPTLYKYISITLYYMMNLFTAHPNDVTVRKTPEYSFTAKQFLSFLKMKHTHKNQAQSVATAYPGWETPISELWLIGPQPNSRRQQCSLNRAWLLWRKKGIFDKKLTELNKLRKFPSGPIRLWLISDQEENVIRKCIAYEHQRRHW